MEDTPYDGLCTPSAQRFTPRKITLETPFTVAGESIKTLEFTRPLRAGDMRGIPVRGMDYEHLFLIGGRLCGQPPKIMEMLEGSDVVSVVEMVSDFLGSGRTTGD